MIDRLKDDDRVSFAATYGRVFKVDPVDVLQCDTFDWALRNAALSIVAQQKKEEAERMKAKR